MLGTFFYLSGNHFEIVLFLFSEVLIRLTLETAIREVIAADEVLETYAISANWFIVFINVSIYELSTVLFYELVPLGSRLSIS